MFKKLHLTHEDSSINLNKSKTLSEITYKKCFDKNAALRKKSQSYGQKFRKKQNLTKIPDLQIVESDTFIFQGRLASIIQNQTFIPTEQQKHGEGVMFLKNGTLIVGTWDHGLLHGRSLIFTPFGGLTTAQFYNGKLNGWAITLFTQKLVVCAVYYDNKIDGEKIIFEANQKMWIGSKYCSETKSFNIIHVQKGKMSELPSFVQLKKTNDLIQLHNDFINNQSCCLILKEIQYISINQNLSYIGYCNQENNPSGLGAIFGKNQFYLGYFRDGSLQCYGRMIFENGEIYQGQLLDGVFYGQGVYYNPSKNLSIIMSKNREEQKVIDEQEGYICINTPLNYFKYIKNGQSGMLRNSLAIIYQIIQKYYSRFFIQNNHLQIDINVLASEIGLSENADQAENLSTKYDDLAKKKLKTEKENLWLNSVSQAASFSNQKPFGQQSKLQLRRVNSLDKRQALHHRQNRAEQPIQDLKRFENSYDQSFLDQINKLQIGRNFSLNERRLQDFNISHTDKVKQNVNPAKFQNFKSKSTYFQNDQDVTTTSKKNTLNSNQKGKAILGEDELTFKNKKPTFTEQIDTEKNKQSKQTREENPDQSQKQSEISNISEKVEKMVQKTTQKRRRIFA